MQFPIYVIQCVLFTNVILEFYKSLKTSRVEYIVDIYIRVILHHLERYTRKELVHTNIFHETTTLALYHHHRENLLLSESRNCASTPALSSLNLRFALLTFARYRPLALCRISHRAEMKMALPKRASEERKRKKKYRIIVTMNIICFSVARYSYFLKHDKLFLAHFD